MLKKSLVLELFICSFLVLTNMLVSPKELIQGFLYLRDTLMCRRSWIQLDTNLGANWCSTRSARKTNVGI